MTYSRNEQTACWPNDSLKILQKHSHLEVLRHRPVLGTSCGQCGRTCVAGVLHGIDTEMRDLKVLRMWLTLGHAVCINYPPSVSQAL